MTEPKMDAKQALSNLIDSIDECGAFYDLESGCAGGGAVVQACEAIDKPIPPKLAKWLRECEAEDCGYDDGGRDHEDPLLYSDGELARLDRARLENEWNRQCNIHDHGVDNLPMGHPTLENASARLRLVEAEQKRRGFAVGPGGDCA